MLPSETMIWQPEFTDKTLSRKPGAVQAGVMLADFTPSGIAQPGLFDEIQPHKNSEKLMKTLDELNQSGKGKVWFAGRGTAPEWQMKREMLSPAYTTRWTDLPVAQL